MDLNVFINAMKKRAAGMPQQPAAGNFVAPQLQPLKKAIGVEPGNTVEPVEKALSNEGIAPGNEAPAQPSDLQMLTESLNNITKLEEMKQKALTKQQQPAAANSVQSAQTVAGMTGSTAPMAASAAPTGQFKGASAEITKQVAMLLKKRASSAAIIAPGLATYGGLYFGLENSKKLKKKRLLRSLLAAAGGIGVSGALYGVTKALAPIEKTPVRYLRPVS